MVVRVTAAGAELHRRHGKSTTDKKRRNQMSVGFARKELETAVGSVGERVRLRGGQMT
jgi:hypothetical protein